MAEQEPAKSIFSRLGGFLAWLLIVVLLYFGLFYVIPALTPQFVKTWWSHTRSSWAGVRRSITLYSGSGAVIASWTCKTSVEDQGGSARFILDDGRVITIAGTYIIEEK
jgi:hypothetical protein